MTDEELQMFKTRTKADLIRGLASNTGLAQQLAVYQTRYGDWRELFRYLEKVDKVTKADIKRVAEQSFPGQQPHCRNHRDRERTGSGRKGATNAKSRGASFLLASHVAPVQRLGLAQPTPWNKLTLSAAAGVSAAAAHAHPIGERHGHLPAAGPRAAVNFGDGDGSRRLDL